MAREPTRTYNEFQNRQPAKIRQPAKLTAAPGHADNCGLHFNPEAVITKRNPLTVCAHVSFVRSLARETTHRSAHDICLPGEKIFGVYREFWGKPIHPFAELRFCPIQPAAIHIHQTEHVVFRVFCYDRRRVSYRATVALRRLSQFICTSRLSHPRSFFISFPLL